MDWALVATLVAKIGLEATDFIMRKQAAANAPVTLAEWAELYALASKSPEAQVTEAITRLGLSVEDPHVAAVLSMARAAK